MSADILPDIFGYVVHHVSLVDQNQSILITIEEYLGHRWLMLYQDTEGEWNSFAQYALFENPLTGPLIPPRNAAIVDTGVSLDGNREYVSIEQNNNSRWVMIYVGGEDGELRLVRELSMEASAQEERVWSEELENDERQSYMKLDELIPYQGEIVSSTMIETRYLRAAFVTELSKDQELLILYHWKEGKWCLEAVFRSTGPDDIHMEPYTGCIQGIYVGCHDEYPSLMVVEENAYLRWWHLYADGEIGWAHSHSWQVFLEPWEGTQVECLMLGEGSVEVPSLANSVDDNDDSSTAV
jgi:hypothetical protein